MTPTEPVGVPGLQRKRAPERAGLEGAWREVIRLSDRGDVFAMATVAAVYISAIILLPITALVWVAYLATREVES